MTRQNHTYRPGDRVITKWGPGTLDTDQTPRLWGTDLAWVVLDTGDRYNGNLYDMTPEPQPDTNTELRQIMADPPAPPTVRTDAGQQYIMPAVLDQAPATAGQQLALL